MLGAFNLDLIQFMSTFSEQQYTYRNQIIRAFYTRHKVSSIKDIFNRFELDEEIDGLCKQANRYALSINKFQIISNAFIFKGTVNSTVEDLQYQFQKCDPQKLETLMRSDSFTEIKQLILKKIVLKELEQALSTLKAAIKHQQAKRPPKYTSVSETALEIENLTRHISITLTESISLQSLFLEKLNFLNISASLQAPEISIPDDIPQSDIQGTPRLTPLITEEQIQTENSLLLLRTKINSLEMMMDHIVEAYAKNDPERLFIASFLETTFSLLLSMNDANIGYQQMKHLDLLLGKSPLKPTNPSSKKIPIKSNTALDPRDKDDSEASSDSENWDDFDELPTDRKLVAAPAQDTESDWDDLEGEFSCLTLGTAPPITPSFNSSASPGSKEAATTIIQSTTKLDSNSKTPVI